MSALVLSAALSAWAQKPDEPKWVQALAYGGAPSCPAHQGIRTRQSETADNGRVRASIIGTTVREQDKKCTFDAEIAVSGTVNRTLHLPNPGKQEFQIVDFSADGSKLLISSEEFLEYPNENFRNVEVSTLPLAGGDAHWVNVWELFGWHDCDATVEPQGFTPDGKAVLRARPSVMRPPRRPDCLSKTGLYTTDMMRSVEQLPDSFQTVRYGRRTAEEVQGCKTDPDIIGECFKVHGRLSAWNGTPTMRIWRVGTKRILGVHDGIMPDYVTKQMNWGVQAFGDFEVCPFTKEQPGAMQMVCVESAEHVYYDRSNAMP